jgi:hypothetical protein
MAAALQVEWGQSIEPDMIRAKLSEGGFDTFTLIHNETSCGVRNALPEIAAVLREAVRGSDTPFECQGSFSVTVNAGGKVTAVSLGGYAGGDPATWQIVRKAALSQLTSRIFEMKSSFVRGALAFHLLQRERFDVHRNGTGGSSTTQGGRRVRGCRQMRGGSGVHRCGRQQPDPPAAGQGKSAWPRRMPELPP